jgi:hypothetical protein
MMLYGKAYALFEFPPMSVNARQLGYLFKVIEGKKVQSLVVRTHEAVSAVDLQSLANLF